MPLPARLVCYTFFQKSLKLSQFSEHHGYMKGFRMPAPRKPIEKALGLALIGAGVSASIWLLGRWHEREQRWRWTREASQGLALNASLLPPYEPETITPNESNEAESWSTQ